VDLNREEDRHIEIRISRSPQGERGFKLQVRNMGKHYMRVAPRRGSVDLNDNMGAAIARGWTSLPAGGAWI